jgi:hypothetical protein
MRRQVSPSRLQERVAYLVRRRLPPGYVTVLLSRGTVQRIRVRGELEHLLGLPALNRFSRVLWSRVIDRCQGTRDVGSQDIS